MAPRSQGARQPEERMDVARAAEWDEQDLQATPSMLVIPANGSGSIRS
jgi:hypothetical protein